MLSYRVPILGKYFLCINVLAQTVNALYFQESLFYAVPAGAMETYRRSIESYLVQSEVNIRLCIHFFSFASPK